MDEPQRPPIDPAAGPWLLYSHKWGMFHRRSGTHAAGYTNELEHAGVFEFEQAQSYHETDPKGRDEAIPASGLLEAMEKRLADMTAARDRFAATIDRIRAHG